MFVDVFCSLRIKEALGSKLSVMIKVSQNSKACGDESGDTTHPEVDKPERESYKL